MINQTVFGWLTKDSEGPFSEKVDAGLTDMTSNSNYTALDAAVTACKAAYAAYQVAKVNAMNGGYVAIAARNARRAELVSLLRALLSNVNAIANGDREKLLTTGFPLRSTARTPLGPLPAPSTPRVTNGPTTGTLKATTQRVYGASLYTARVALASAPEVYVQTVQGTGSRFLFEGLTPGELYNVEMNVIGAAGASDWSDAGTMRAL